MDNSNGYTAVSPAPSTSASGATAAKTNFMDIQNNLMTPKKTFLDSLILREIRKQLNSPGGCDIQSIQIDSTSTIKTENLNLIKDRYLLSSSQATSHSQIYDGVGAVKRNLTDISSSNNLKCLDIYTEENFLCKIVNEPIDKVKMAYFRLSDSPELIRPVRDIIPLSKNRTYVIIPLDNGYENLHTYIRDKRRLGETEARNIYQQICQTLNLCHQNGIILRDLKLKRFYFLDKERTQIQYESLEGSIILDDPEIDTLYEKIGCPLYTAPELLTPNSTFRGKPADMWSLGVILYTMLVGQYPFNEKNGHSLLTNIRNCNIAIPTVLSGKVRCLMRSLLRKNPEERLVAEDIFFHPWMKEKQSTVFWSVSRNENNDDHCVPDIPIMETDDVDMG